MTGKDIDTQRTVISYLVANGAKINAKDKDGSTPLHFAATRGSTEACVELVSFKGIKIEVSRTRVCRSPFTEYSFSTCICECFIFLCSYCCPSSSSSLCSCVSCSPCSFCSCAHCIYCLVDGIRRSFFLFVFFDIEDINTGNSFYARISRIC